ncbi:MAG: bifunctional UDP-sugar hydrolase/5'-nucleotidase [Pseudomonadota bacterium]
MPTAFKSLLASLFLAVALTGCASSTVRQITILHTNDMHGRHLPIRVASSNATAQTGDPGRTEQDFGRAGMIGGFAHLAGAVETVRRQKGAENVVLVDGGDTFGDDLLGNITKGEAMIRLMNAVGYDLMALGNHDFDYGVDRTAELQRIAQFPLRGANVLASDGAPFGGAPYLIKEVGGVRLAILTLGYHNTDRTGSPKNVAGLSFTNGIEVARRIVPMLRQKADVVVVLSHQGSKVDREMAEQVGEIDLIIAAHSHDKMSPPEEVNGVWIAQAMSDGTMLGQLTLTVDESGLIGVDGKLIELWNDQVKPDPTLTRMIAELRAPHRDRLETVLATANARIGRRYKSESPFDTLAGEIMREASGAEIAFLPGVGYGVTIEPGPITREQLYALLPHPSKMVTMTLSGQQVMEILEQSASNQKARDPMKGIGGLIQTSGLAFTVDLNRPEGQRVLNVLVSNRPLSPERSYKIVTNAGMRDGIHNYTSFARGRDVKEDSRSVTEVVENGFRKRRAIDLPALGRVKLIKASE